MILFKPLEDPSKFWSWKRRIRKRERECPREVLPNRVTWMRSLRNKHPRCSMIIGSTQVGNHHAFKNMNSRTFEFSKEPLWIGLLITGNRSLISISRTPQSLTTKPSPRVIKGRSVTLVTHQLHPLIVFFRAARRRERWRVRRLELLTRRKALANIEVTFPDFTMPLSWRI